MNKRQQKPHDRAGFVYVMTCDQYAKIGRVGGQPNDAARRLIARYACLQVGSPHEIELAAYVWVRDAFDWEVALHHQFKHAHHRGEWFKFTAHDYEALVGALEARATEHVDPRGVEELIAAGDWHLLRLKLGVCTPEALADYRQNGQRLPGQPPLRRSKKPARRLKGTINTRQETSTHAH